MLQDFGLPAFVAPDGTDIPAWLQLANELGLKIECRVVDFLPSQTAGQMQLWLASLLHDSSTVAFTHVASADQPQQIGNSCGYVAARAILHMYDADDILTCDVSDATQSRWISQGNAHLCALHWNHSHNPIEKARRQRLDEAHFLTESEVLHLLDYWWKETMSVDALAAMHTKILSIEPSDPPSGECHRCGERHPTATCPNFATPATQTNERFAHQWCHLNSLDYVVRRIAENLASVCRGDVPLHNDLFIVNSEESTHSGLHWFALACTIEMPHLSCEDARQMSTLVPPAPNVRGARQYRYTGQERILLDLPNDAGLHTTVAAHHVATALDYDVLFAEAMEAEELLADEALCDQLEEESEMFSGDH